MDRSDKTAVIDELRGRFESAPFVVLANYVGSRPLELDAIRVKCEPLGVHFRVVKNTLARRAVVGTPFEVLASHFKGNTGVIFSNEDAQAAAKALREIIKENDKINVKVGFFDGTVLDGKGVAGVADLPSKAELLTRLLQTINEGPRQILGVLQASGRDLAYLLANHASELEKKG